MSVQPEARTDGDPLARLQRRYEREREARRQAEELLEKKSRELFESNQSLRRFSEELEELVRQRTQELQMARDEAIAHSRAKSLFLANMSHELRTPMNGVLGMLQVLQQSVREPAQRRLVSTAIESGQLLLQVIADILDFTKIESGHLELETIAFDPRELMESALYSVAHAAVRKSLVLINATDPRLPPLLRGDPTRLKQILCNFLSNAVKFTLQGEITLTAAWSDGLLDLSVKDTGIGMNADQLSRVFEAFAQADSSTTRRFGGTGLGLSISQRLAENMQGHIEVTSTPGRGSCFRLRCPLPLVGADKEAGLEAASVREGLVNDASPFLDQRFVIVDEHPARALTLMRRLSDLGAVDCRVMAHWCEDEINEWARMSPPDAIFHDLEAGPGPDPERWPVIALVNVETLQAPQYPIVLTQPIRHRDLLQALTRVRDTAARSTPLAPRPQAEPGDALPPRPPPISRLTGRRILLVDDNQINREVGEALLQMLGVSVTLACDGADAVSRVQREVFDAVLMDVQMPQMDGHEACRRIRQLGGAYRFLPIVAMTAHALAEDREASAQAGMNAHLTKPISPERLEEVLDRVLTTLDVLNVEPALARMGGNWPLYQRILDLFLTDKSDAVKRLQGYLHDGHWTDAGALAHALKGGAATVGAEALADIARRIEAACRTANDREARSLAPDLQSAWSTLQIHAQRLAGDRAPSEPTPPMATASTSAPMPLDSPSLDSVLALKQRLHDFLQSLDDDLGTAESVLGELQGMARDTPWAGALTSIALAFRQFDFDTTRQSAQALASALGSPEA